MVWTRHRHDIGLLELLVAWPLAYACYFLLGQIPEHLLALAFPQVRRDGHSLQTMGILCLLSVELTSCDARDWNRLRLLLDVRVDILHIYLISQVRVTSICLDALGELP